MTDSPMSEPDTPESVRALADGIDHLQDSRQLRRHAAEVLSRYAALLASSPAVGEVEQLRADLAEAQAENERWRAAKGPFDEALCDLSGALILAGLFPDPPHESGGDGSAEDYRAACQNVVDGVRAALARLSADPAPAPREGAQPSQETAMTADTLPPDRLAELPGPFLLMKRDLYWRPNSAGYTGAKVDAGRYTAEEVEPYLRDPRYGVSVIPEAEAPEFTRACWPEVKAEVLTRSMPGPRRPRPRGRDGA